MVSTPSDVFIAASFRACSSSLKLRVTELDMLMPEHDVPTVHGPGTYEFRTEISTVQRTPAARNMLATQAQNGWNAWIEIAHYGA